MLDNNKLTDRSATRRSKLDRKNKVVAAPVVTQSYRRLKNERKNMKRNQSCFVGQDSMLPSREPILSATPNISLISGQNLQNSLQKPNKMQELIKQNLKVQVLESKVEKYEALVKCYKSENKYTSDLLSKTNKEKMQLYKEKKEIHQQLKNLKAKDKKSQEAVKEIIKEVPVIVEVEKVVIKEVIKEIPVTVEVERVVEKEKIVEVIKEVIVEKEIVKEVIVEKIVEKIVEQIVEKEIVKEIEVQKIEAPNKGKKKILEQNKKNQDLINNLNSEIESLKKKLGVTKQDNENKTGLQNHKFSLVYSVPTHIIYKTLTDQMEICRFTQGQAVSVPQPGGELKMYDGMIQGIYKELVENQKIVMQWRMKDWVDGCFCDVTLLFHNGGNDDCQLSVDFKKIPEYDTYNKFVHLDNLEGGWKQMIFQKIEQVFGYPIKK